MGRIWEALYPVILAIIVMLLIYCLGWNLSDVKNISSILNSGVTIGSIVIAFLATMISILITITNAEVMKRINKTDSEGVLISYIKVTIISGFLLAIYSTILHAFIDLEGTASKILLIIFGGLLTFFVFSAYRIIHVFSKILKAVLAENKSTTKKKKKIKPKINGNS